MEYRIGTRGSKLALIQAGQIQTQLQEAYPQDVFELQVIKTKGDALTDRPLDQIGGSGVFVKEIEKQLLTGEIQLAVHSMKDMPCELPESLQLLPAGIREDPRDALVLRTGADLNSLPPGARIATGSSRRRLQLLRLRPDLQIVGIRGNVETRLRKMQVEQLDGVILAAAGLKRLGLEAQITQYLEPEEMVPAPTQGILGIEVLAEDTELIQKIRQLSAASASSGLLEDQAACERLFLREMGADCHLPIGAYLDAGLDGYKFYALYGTADGSRLSSVCLKGTDPMQLAMDAARRIRGQQGGRVTLVGAGPGDPGLLTVRGRQALMEADCVVYDRLISEELLELVRPDCERIYVGKANAHHTLPQEQINELLFNRAMQYPSVVRLKGGDPYVFGRGAEEALYLRSRGVRCEVVPGVTAATAALADAGIPVTHREITSGFRAVTAHARENGEAAIDYEGMAHTEDTCIFYMGLSELESITQKLIAAGKPADTPAAVISHGTTAQQQGCTGTRADIAGKVQTAALTSPAIIVIGKVVSLQKQLNFFEQQPLFGRRYLVAETTPLPAQRAGTKDRASLVQMLRASGAQAERVITGRIVRIPAQMTAQQLRTFDWLLFTSCNAVAAFMDNLWESGLDGRCLEKLRIACIGKETACTLASCYLHADVIAKQADSASFAGELGPILAEQTARQQQLPKVLYPQNRADTHTLTDMLADRCILTELPVYENQLPSEEDPFTDDTLLTFDGICFTNALSVRRLLSNRPTRLMQELSGRGSFYAIGSATARALKELGASRVNVADEPSCEALYNKICENK